MKVRELIRVLEKDGWTMVRAKGSHHLFKHPSKAGAVIVAMHSGDVPIGTLHSILKQAGLEQVK